MRENPEASSLKIILLLVECIWRYITFSSICIVYSLIKMTERKLEDIEFGDHITDRGCTCISSSLGSIYLFPKDIFKTSAWYYSSMRFEGKYPPCDSSREKKVSTEIEAQRCESAIGERCNVSSLRCIECDKERTKNKDVIRKIDDSLLSSILIT